MPDDATQHRDRYTTSGNVETEYVDAARTVLVNKKGFTTESDLLAFEAIALAKAYAVLLATLREDTTMTCDLLKHIHACIFGELYQWAGRWRTVWISKPGVTWPAPDFLDRNMREYEQNVLQKYPASSLDDREAFCEATGEIQGEFLVVHPFREGNARTIRLMTDLMALQTGRQTLAYDVTDIGKQRYIEAAQAAFKRNYRPMIAVIRLATEHWPK